MAYSLDPDTLASLIIGELGLDRPGAHSLYFGELSWSGDTLTGAKAGARLNEGVLRELHKRVEEAYCIRPGALLAVWSTDLNDYLLLEPDEQALIRQLRSEGLYFLREYDTFEQELLAAIADAITLRIMRTLHPMERVELIAE